MFNLARFCLILLCCLPFPTFAAELGAVLEGLDGKQHALGGYVGQSKWTVIAVWGPRCRYCHEEMPERQRLHRTRGEDINVIGVAIDYPTMGLAKMGEVRDFVRKHQLTYPILLADGGIVPTLGGGELIGTPTTLINSRGELVAKQPGRVSNQVIEDFIAKSTTPANAVR